MPFHDTKDGQTHSMNDGCGEPAHNPFQAKAEEIADETQFECVKLVTNDCNHCAFVQRVASALAEASREGGEKVVKAVEARWIDMDDSTPEGADLVETARAAARSAVDKKCRFDDCNKLEKDCLETYHRE